jgi:hypothetical protein
VANSRGGDALFLWTLGFLDMETVQQVANYLWLDENAAQTYQDPDRGYQLRYTRQGAVRYFRWLKLAAKHGDGWCAAEAARIANLEIAPV